MSPTVSTSRPRGPTQYHLTLPPQGTTAVFSGHMACVPRLGHLDSWDLDQMVAGEVRRFLGVPITSHFTTSISWKKGQGRVGGLISGCSKLLVYLIDLV